MGAPWFTAVYTNKYRPSYEERLCYTMKFSLKLVSRIKNNKKTEWQEKFPIVTGLCSSREERQTQKFGIDHLRWEGGLATENRFKVDVWSNGWKPIVVILFKFKQLWRSFERLHVTNWLAKKLPDKRKLPSAILMTLNNANKTNQRKNWLTSLRSK